MPRLSKARKELLNTLMRDSIFEATTSVLSEYGVDGATMNRVAAAADVAKSSLYDYFASKEELLQFVSDRISSPFLQGIEEIVPTLLPAPQKLERIIRIAFEHANRHKGVIRLLVDANQDRQVRSTNRPRMLAALIAIFEQGIREGSFHPHNPEHTSRMLMGCLAELFELQVSNAAEAVVRDYVEVLIEVALHGLSIHVAKECAVGRANSPSPGA